MKRLAVVLAVLSVLGVCSMVPATSNILGTETIAQATQFQYYKVTGNGVRIRKEPNTNSKILGQVYKGDKIMVLGDLGNGWLNIYWNGQRAYISAQYCKYYSPGGYL